jgi:hypothetical protein
MFLTSPSVPTSLCVSACDPNFDIQFPFFNFPSLAIPDD